MSTTSQRCTTSTSSRSTQRRRRHSAAAAAAAAAARWCHAGSARRRTPILVTRAAGNGNSSSSSSRDSPDQAAAGSGGEQADSRAQPFAPPPPPQQEQPRLPALMDGVNWFCYCCLGLLFLTDLTPVGQWLLAAGPVAGSSGTTSALSAAGGGFPARLAALQWLTFVLPTLVWARRSGWDLRQTLKLQQPGSARSYATALLAGPVLWLAINCAIAARTGNLEQFAAALSFSDDSLSATTATASASAGATDVLSPGMLLLGVGSSSSAVLSTQQVLSLLLFAALSPAVAEELLFRGLLLTAVQQRLGSIDAVAVVAALFAVIHLEPQQFFLYCVLGAACGLAAVRSGGSVGPAIVLHAAFNATAVAAALLLHVGVS